MGIVIAGMAEREIPEGYEVWGMPWDPEWTRFDVMFDLHHPSLLDEKHANKVKEVYQPLFMQEEFYPNAQVYPLDDVIAITGDYFSCTISYILGYAIYKDVKDIIIVGVTGDEDYSYQRPGLEYMIGVARGRGINVDIRGKTELFTGDRYGYI